jgi:hypothetical protein
MSDDEDGKKDDDHQGASRVPSQRRRSIFDNDHEGIEYKEILDKITENNKEAKL